MTRATGAALLAAALHFAAAGAAAQTPAQPQPLRLAYINSAYILANTPGRSEAESTFNREMAGFRAEVQRMQQTLDSAVAEYQRTSLVMTPAARQQRESELRQMEQRTRQRATELEQQAARREQELTAPITQRVNAVIEGIRAEFNYSMIFDAAAPSGALVTADRALDISNLVIQRLQQGSQQGPGGALQPGAGPPPAAAGAGVRPQQPPADTTRPAQPPPPSRGRRP
jgi:outer membrane protein